MIANIVGAGIGAILPLIMEAMRSKPDPEAAKAMLRSQRQARVEEAIGAGMSMQQAEKQVDAQLQQEFDAADEAGEFNTPWGEMVAGAVLGLAVPWAAGKIGSMVKAGAKVATGAAGATDDVAAAAAKAAKIDTPAEQALVRPASGQVKVPDLVSADELAPVQMQAEARSRMQPSAMDIRNTRMLNGVPAPVRQAPAAAATSPATPVASPFPAKPMSASDEIAAKLEARQAYDAKLRSMDNTDPSLVSAVDEMMPAGRPLPMGPFPARVEQGMVDDMMPSSAFRRPAPEFLPGEMQSRTPSASMRPWDDLPEVKNAKFRSAIDNAHADANMGIGPTVTGEIQGTMPTRMRIRDTSLIDAEAQLAQEKAMWELRRRQMDAAVLNSPFPESLARPRTTGYPILSYSGT